MTYVLSSPPFLADAAAPLRGFKAYELDTSRNPVPSYNRFDFYKVSLLTGHIVVQYATRTLELKGTHLFFASPRLPYSTLLLSAQVTGYACLFTEAFVQSNSGLVSFHHSPLFQPDALPACPLSSEQAIHCTEVFEQMLAAQHSGYIFKGELLASYLQLLLHEGIRMQERLEDLFLPRPAATGSTPQLLG
ncbi:hypothetical protein [Hymenobacter guriensis]|uniref:AraC family transcriptional regulator n=1 Tax=Hymenobacter guriensis TaxID=2793065 RepID=A0ABS0L4M0_9BACT|nr:hypothetical protein [Hymenobacter guriensis]MBG8555067.1 hypothetical protein [Hymenobacter guriensis]